MRRQRRGNVDLSQICVFQGETPSMKMKLTFYAVYKQIGHITIFLVAEYGRAEDIHVRAKLMLPPRHRFQRNPGQFAGAVDDGIMSGGVLRQFLLSGPGSAHPVALGPAALTSAASTLPCGGLGMPRVIAQ